MTLNIFRDHNGNSFDVRPDYVARFLIIAAVCLIFASSGLILKPLHTIQYEIMRGGGAAMVILLLNGRRYWPAVFLAFVAAQLLQYWRVSFNAPADKLIYANLLIAFSTTFQAVLGATLMRRLFGYPLHFRNARELFCCLALIGPVICLITATVGVAVLTYIGIAGVSMRTWLTWWIGDIIGVYMAAFIVLLGPWTNQTSIVWKSEALPRYRATAAVYLSLSILLTLGSWTTLNHAITRNIEEEFLSEVEVKETELRHRIERNRLAAEGMVGLLQASETVTDGEWRTFVDFLDLPKQYQGLEAIGLIDIANQNDRMVSRNAGHSEAVELETLRIRHSRPRDSSPGTADQTITLDKTLALAAAESRDSAKPVIITTNTNKSGTDNGANFLVLHPIYKINSTLDTVEQRRAANKGWVFARLDADALIKGLSSAHEVVSVLSVSDTTGISRHNLIYYDPDQPSEGTLPAYRLTRAIPVFNTSWTITWGEQPAFRGQQNKYEAAIIGLSGIAFTLLLAAFLMSRERVTQTVQKTVQLRTQELATQVNENLSIIESAIANIAVLDGNGIILSVNQAISQLLGRPRDEIIGRSVTLFIEGALDEHLADAKVGSTIRKAVSIRNNDGHVVVLELEVNSWTTDTGELRHTILLHDITQMHLTMEQLSRTQQRLDVALSGANIGIFELDGEMAVAEASPTWAAVMGFSPEAAAFSVKEWSDRVHPDDLPMVQARFRACAEGHSERSISEYRVRNADGAWHWMRTEAVAIDRDSGHATARIVGVTMDITEIKKIDEAKKNFVATVSHELRTPLTSIKGSIQLLLGTMQRDLPEKAQHLILIANRNCDRLVYLVNDLLDLEKLASGKTEFHIQIAEARTLVQRSISESQPYAEKFGVHFQFSPPDAALHVAVDAGRFQQIMANLLSNAAKFSSQGATIQISIIQQRKRVRVSVTNTGAGVPVAFQNRIFRPFSQADSSAARRNEGSGLGLNISKQIVERMGGEIGFVSEPGKMTTFWFTLPLVDADDSAIEPL